MGELENEVDRHVAHRTACLVVHAASGHLKKILQRVDEVRPLINICFDYDYTMRPTFEMFSDRSLTQPIKMVRLGLIYCIDTIYSYKSRASPSLDLDALSACQCEVEASTFRR